MGNRQTNENLMETCRNVHVDYVSYLENPLPWKIDEIFSVKAVFLLGPQMEHNPPPIL